MGKSFNNYANHLKNLIDQVEQTQENQIENAAQLIADTIMKGNSIFAFGASHAGMLSMELFYRTGGLVNINPIFAADLMSNIRPATLTSDIERLEGYGTLILRNTSIKEGDVLILHSVSGRNAVTIDMGLEAKKLGIKVIVITNLTYTSIVTSRHSSHLKLKDVGDIVIDNCGEFEDSSQKIDGVDQKMGPTSTIIGAFIVNGITLKVAEKLVEKGVEVPVFHSANIDGGDEHNKALMEKYKNNIFYM
ncbi:MAG: SIS domain-containing protein [Erysipelotrichaceae bacterium]|nr:SIS domain-containing protein [Erysipelotrichaceae bacterium]